MNNKTDLLSIGEVAKLTGTGIQALRYYERKNILQPAFTDPDTGYRYYSLDQLYHVVIISNCVQLGIPLKELTSVLGHMANMENFLLNCNKVAQRKIEILQAGIDGFNDALRKIEMTGQYQPGQIYSREFEQKYYYTQPFTRPPAGGHLIKSMVQAVRTLYGENFSRIVDSDKLDDFPINPDLGCLCKFSADGFSYFGFTEVSEKYVDENTVNVPAGNYFFMYNENSLLERAGEIFEDYIKDADNFMIVETQEAFYSKTKLNRPMYELRLITNSVGYHVITN